MLGLGLAAAYLYPAAVEQDLIRHEYVADNWPYHESYIFAETQHTHTYRGFFDLIDQTWLISAAVILITGIALILLMRATQGPPAGLRRNITAWTTGGCAALFMMTSLSEAIGRLIPGIEIGVFPWRMLSITTLFAALIAGACAEAAISGWKERSATRSLIFGLLAVSIVAGSIMFSAMRVIWPTRDVAAFEPEAEHFSYATMPRTAPANPESLPKIERARFDSGKARIGVERWDPERRVMEVEADQPGRLWIRTFHFPGWTATVNGFYAQIERGEQFGEMIIPLSAGRHRIVVDYRNTPARAIGEFVTASSTGILLIIFALSRRGRTLPRIRNRF
jgi:hypothetical protein